MNAATYYVDEAGDGVLFGPKGRSRLSDRDASKFFMLGMIRCVCDERMSEGLEELRKQLLANPLYASIPSMQPDQQKTALAFHAKDDHPEIRAKVFEWLIPQDFKFYAVIKDMRAVEQYVQSRNQMHASYRYHPNELYDLTVRMLFKNRLHKHAHCHITFARRGKSDRTEALIDQLKMARQKFLDEHDLEHQGQIEIHPAYPHERPCLQIADYCLWALQRCYERHEDRFLRALWPKVSIIHDVDDLTGKKYGTFFTRDGPMPDIMKIKSRWI